MPDSGTKIPNSETTPISVPAVPPTPTEPVKTLAGEEAVTPTSERIPTAPAAHPIIESLAAPLPSLPLQVFGIITAIVLLATAIGYGLGSWLATSAR